MSVQKIARLFVVSGLLLLPATAWAQSETGTIAGVVKDTSGAVMPGVTVEAVSPAVRRGEWGRGAASVRQRLFRRTWRVGSDNGSSDYRLHRCYRPEGRD